MNKTVYRFLSDRFLKEKSKVEFTKKLTSEDIKDFISKTYGIMINSVEEIDFYKDNVITFRFGGVYLHAGFNNISFDGIFTADDFSYQIKTAIWLVSVNKVEEWKNFMIGKFGKKYVRRMRKHGKIKKAT